MWMWRERCPLMITWLEGVSPKFRIIFNLNVIFEVNFEVKFKEKVNFKVNIRCTFKVNVKI